VAPTYPGEARDKGIQGRVILRVLVTENGDVESAEVLSGTDVLREAAIDAAKKWKFEPLVVDGKAVRVRTTIPFTFQLGNNYDVKKKLGGDVADDLTDPHQAVILQGSTPTRVRVSSAIAARHLVRSVEPIYPLAAKENHVQGTVVLHAIIGNDGIVQQVKVVAGPKELTQAAAGAVELWRYSPLLVEGKPAEMDTTVEVHFTLGR
jgi:TonB family protein